MNPQRLLSKREQDVVRLLLEGKSNKLIAHALGITERTVEFHLKNIYAKHQVNSRMELVLHLRQSTVAAAGEGNENSGTSNFWDWAKSTFQEAVHRIGKELHMTNATNAPVSEQDPKTFQDAIRVCFIKYADFTGRASRPEFWWFTLFILLSASAFTYISETAGSIYSIATLLPFLAVGARLLRDSGNNPWWLFGLLIPVGGIILLGFYWAAPPVKSFTEDSLPA
jgi:DNA-binding CsgD family transcriptional regulator